jgi:hypothetical protein
LERYATIHDELTETHDAITRLPNRQETPIRRFTRCAVRGGYAWMLIEAKRARQGGSVRAAHAASHRRSE